jgi:hypothetical protein
VNVVVDDVVWRRCDIDRRAYPYRNGRIIGHRKHERKYRRGWWREIYKIYWPRRQEDNWRRRRRSELEIGIVEDQHRPFNINHFLHWRWRHIICDDGKIRRWVKCRREICKPSSGIVRVSAAGVAPEIRPVRWRSIDIAGVTPRQRFATCCDDSANASRHRIVGISAKEGLVILKRVTIDCGEIGFLRAEIAKWPRTYR